MKRIIRMSGLLLMALAFVSARNNAGEFCIRKDEALAKRMALSADHFLKILTADQKKEAMAEFADPARFDWHFTPRDRKGLPLKKMNAEQKAAALRLMQLGLSTEGFRKAGQIIDLENVLRGIENRPPDDTCRDPENFAFLIYGNPGKNDPWAWRVEGHHLSLHFTFVNGEIVFTPGFMGSNPGKVLADVPQKGKRILSAEQDLAFDLLHSMRASQLEKVLLGTTPPNEIFTSNSRKASLENIQGLAMKEMRAEQKTIFKKLIMEYLQRYHVTLKNQQWSQLEKAGLDRIHFAWMGDRQPLIGAGHGHYYRIHGPSFLIEFDNTQNGGNHIHSVVRDLNNDFGEDMLQAHYKNGHTLVK